MHSIARALATVAIVATMATVARVDADDTDIVALASDTLWEPLPSFVEARYGAELVHCAGMDILLLFGGENVNRLPINTISAFDYASDTWTFVQEHPDSTPLDEKLWGSVVALEEGIDEFNSEECIVGFLPSQRSKEAAHMGAWVGRVSKSSTDAGRFLINWHSVTAASLWDGVSHEPPARQHHSVGQYNGKMYLFGGRQWNGEVFADLNDLWVLSFVDQEFTKGVWRRILQPTGTRWPSGRFDASLSAVLTYKSGGGGRSPALAMYGGEQTVVYQGDTNVAYFLNDMWQFDIVNEVWRYPRLASYTYTEFARARASMVGVGDTVLLFGGTTSIPTGGRLVDYVFDDVLVSSAGIVPQHFCSTDRDIGVGLWCALNTEGRTSSSSPFDTEEVTPLRRFSHASTIRRVLTTSDDNTTVVERTEMIIAGGIGQSTRSYERSTLEYVLADVWALDVASLLEAELVVAHEQFAPHSLSPQEQSMYFFFAVLALTLGMLCVASFRGHDVEGFYWQSIPGFAVAPGAKSSDLKALPLVYFESNPSSPIVSGGDKVCTPTNSGNAPGGLTKSPSHPSPESINGNDQQLGTGTQQSQQQKQPSSPECRNETSDVDSVKHTQHNSGLIIHVPTHSATSAASGSFAQTPPQKHSRARVRGDSSMRSPAPTRTRQQASGSVISGIFPRFSAGSFSRGGSFGSLAGGRSFAARTLGRLTRGETLADEWKDQCSICLCEFEEGEQLLQLPCAHVFNPECIEAWLRKKASCPLCKRKIDDNESPSLGNLPKYRTVPNEEREWEPTPDVVDSTDLAADNPLTTDSTMLVIVPLSLDSETSQGGADDVLDAPPSTSSRPSGSVDGVSRFFARVRGLSLRNVTASSSTVRGR